MESAAGINDAAHHSKRVMTWIVGEGRQDSDARTVAFFLSRALVDFDKGTDTRLIEPVASRCLSNFPENVRPLVELTIVSYRSRRWRFRFGLGSPASADRQKWSAISITPKGGLLAW